MNKKKWKIIMNFWNKNTLFILSLSIIIPLINIYFSYMFKLEGYGIANSISLFSAFLVLLTSLYIVFKNNEITTEQINNSNKRLKEQLLFEKRQDVALELIRELEYYKQYIDEDYINSHDKEIYDEKIENAEFFILDIYDILYSIRFSYKFYYYSKDIQKLIKYFITYFHEHSDYKYYREWSSPLPNQNDNYKLIKVVSKIYENLKNEIGDEL